MPKGSRPAEPLSPAEVKALLAACDSQTLTGVRNHALLVTLWRCGLRIAEALSLRCSDVNFSAGTIRVLHTKTGVPRTVGIDDAALAVLGIWIDARAAAGIGAGPLFCRLKGQPGAPLSARYVGAEIARLAVRAGVEHRVHPHGFRHSMAMDWSRKGVPVPKISGQLGHGSVATTQVYLDHLHPAEVIAVARGLDWD